MGKRIRKNTKRVLEIEQVDHIRYKMCSNKVSYDTEIEAQLRTAKWGNRVYKCEFCDSYHTTTKNNKDWSTGA